MVHILYPTHAIDSTVMTIIWSRWAVCDLFPIEFTDAQPAEINPCACPFKGQPHCIRHFNSLAILITCLYSCDNVGIIIVKGG